MDELLKYAVKNGMIDLAHISNQIEMNKRKEFLEKHPYKIWQGKNGSWYTYLPDKNKSGGRKLIRKATQKAVEDEIVTYWKAEIENPTIEEVFTEWNYRRLELQKISPATFDRSKRIFEKHFSEFGKRRIKSVEPEEILEFLEEQIPKYDMTAKAFSNLKTVMRGIIKRARRRKLIDFSADQVFQDLDTSETDFKKTIKEDYQEVFDEDETAIITQYLAEHPDIWNLGILLIFATGIRIGELVTLKWQDFTGDTVHICRTETKYKDSGGNNICAVKEFPKTGAGVRTVVIPKKYQWIYKELRRLNPFGEYIFEKNGKRMTVSCFSNRLYRVCDKLGIYKKSPHKIRKTYGSILLDNHIDQRFVIEQMGHTNILTTENHYHRNRRSTDEKIRIVSDIPEFRESGMITYLPKCNQM